MDADESSHAACLELLESHPGPLLVPALCVAEVAHIAAARLGWESEVRFLGDLASGALSIEAVHASDLTRIPELVAAYRDLPLGSVDASVVAAAERLGAVTIATLDRRHFGVVRPRHADAFELVP